MADLRIVDAPVLLQESITDDVKMPTGGLGNFSIRLGDIVWYVVTKEQLANKNYVDLSSKGVKDSLDEHIADKANPHEVTKGQVGLGNVDNTADIDKPVSDATKSAIITATTDMATKAYVNQKDNLKADITYVDSKDGDLTTLTTTDKTSLVKAINEVVSVKANKATTLVGYGISDAYTKSEIDTNYGGVKTLYDKNVQAGAGANGWTAELIVDGDKTQKQINSLLKSKKLVDTRMYGLVVNTNEDQTPAIHAAFADNPQSNAFYIPSGVIHANIVFPRESMVIVGDGMQNTFIQPFDLSKPTVDFNTKLYPSLQELTVQAGQDYTSENLINAKDVRYMYLLDMAARKTVKDGEQHQYKTILIDNRAVNGTWTGYNRLHGVYATYGAYGYLADVTKLNSDLSIKDGAYNGNGYFNIKTAMSNSIISNCEIADGGKLQPQNTYDETKYGGVYVAGNNSVIYAIWHEYNAAIQPSYSPNNVYIEPTAHNITHNYGRDSRSLQNVRIYSKSQGELQNVNTADTAINDGQGRSRPNQLIKNGCFRYWDTLTNKPMGWGTYYAGTWSQELSDLPKGFNTGFKLVSGDIAGAIGVYQTIFDAADLANSMIKNIALWAGREISMSFWLKNLGSSSSVVRVGISVNENNIYLSNGNFIAETKIGEWTKYIVNYKIIGNETKIAIGARMAGVNQGMIVTGFSVADDCKVNDFQAKPITEDGGEIYGTLEVKGAITKNGLELLNKPSAVYTENLSSINDPVNKTGKFAGRQIFNNSDSKMYYTVGGNANSAWKAFDSSNVISPT